MTPTDLLVLLAQAAATRLSSGFNPVAYRTLLRTKIGVFAISARKVADLVIAALGG